MRLAISLLIAVVINLGLFSLMQSMTSVDDVEHLPVNDLRLLDFVRVKQETTTAVKQRQLPDKPTPPETKPPPPMKMVATQQPQRVTPKMPAPNIAVPLNIAGGPYLGEFTAAPAVTAPVVQASENIMPLVRIPPRYPRSAARRNLEGVVKVAFTITKNGLVRDAKVVLSEPEGVFDRAALKAISKWKFNPKVVNGQPVEQAATQEIEFTLPK